MDTTKNFDGYAKDYTAGRPNYAINLSPNSRKKVLMKAIDGHKGLVAENESFVY